MSDHETYCSRCHKFYASNALDNCPDCGYEPDDHDEYRDYLDEIMDNC